MIRQVAHNGAGSFEVRFPFNRELVDRIKTLPRRRWNAAGRFWSVPEQDVVSLVDLLCDDGFTCVMEGDTCVVDADCCTNRCDASGVCIDSGTSCLPDGETCTSHGNCCSEFCLGGRCSTDGTCRAVYNEETATEKFPAFRDKLEDLFESGVVELERVAIMRDRIAAFDEAYGWREKVSA